MNKGGTVRISLRELAYASVIVAALAVAGHELAGRAEAQGGNQQVVGFASDGYSTYTMVAGGDVYRQRANGPGGEFLNAPVYVGNFWTGTGATSIQPQTWSQIKAAHGGR